MQPVTFFIIGATFTGLVSGLSLASALVDPTNPVETTSTPNMNTVDSCANFKVILYPPAVKVCHPRRASNEYSLIPFQISTCTTEISIKLVFEYPGSDAAGNPSDRSDRQKNAKMILKTLNVDDENGGRW